MTSLHRVRASWTGFVGAPGVSTFYFLDTATAVDSLFTFYNTIKDLLPTDVSITVANTGDIIEDTTGDLTGSWGADPVAAVVGVDGSVYAAPVGGMVGWETGTILDHHRLRGRTFIVPLAGDQYGPDGSINDAKVTELLDAGIALVAEQSASFVIWHRPRAARAADGSRPAVEARAGGHGLVTLARVPDKAVVLRSRRD